MKTFLVLTLLPLALGFLVALFAFLAVLLSLVLLFYPVLAVLGYYYFNKIHRKMRWKRPFFRWPSEKGDFP